MFNHLFSFTKKNFEWISAASQNYQVTNTVFIEILCNKPFYAFYAEAHISFFTEPFLFAKKKIYWRLIFPVFYKKVFISVAVKIAVKTNLRF